MASSPSSLGKTNVNAYSGPPPASTGGVSISLLPVSTLPAGYNFSQATEHNCLVCQDYTTIDHFAKDCRLRTYGTPMVEAQVQRKPA